MTQPHVTAKRTTLWGLVCLAILAPLGLAAWGGPDDTIIAWNVEVVGQIGGGWGEAVAVEGNYAFLCQGRNLIVLDVGNPSSPTQAARLFLGEPAFALHVQGAVAFIPAGGKLHIIDVSNPLGPAVLNVYAPPDPCRGGIHVANNLVYCIGYHYTPDPSPDYSFQIFDISDLTSPTFLGSCGGISMAYKWAIDVSDGLAYVANGGLVVIDVTNPAAPTRVSSPINYAFDVEVSGRRAYLASGSGGFRIVDFTDPSSPMILGHWPAGYGVYRLDVADSIVYIGEYQDLGFRILDIADPSSPTLRGSVKTSAVVTLAEDVLASGTLAFSSHELGLRIIDVHDPDAPALLGHYDEPGACMDVDVADGKAYIAWYPDYDLGHCGNVSLGIIDVGNPRLPRMMGALESIRGAWRVAVSGNVAYLGTFNGLHIVDVTDPTSPVTCAFNDDYNFSLGPDLQTTADRLYFVSEGWLHVLDASEPSSPTLLYGGPPLDVESAFFVSGEIAYLSNWTGGLRLFDLSDPSSPVFIASYGQSSEGVFVAGDRAYVGGIGILDVSDPTSPTLIGDHDLLTGDLSVSGPLAVSYWHDESRMIRILDVSDATSPTHCGSFSVQGATRNIDFFTRSCVETVWMDGDLIYAVTRGEGLWILRYTGPRAPGAAARASWQRFE